MILASEMNVSIRITSGPALERAGDLAALLTSLQPGDILFIDEIHRLSLAVEEVLYPAMEDYSVDIILGKGPKARDVRLKVAPFTLVGATTRFSLISQPLRDRFGSSFRLEFYDPPALIQILNRSAEVLNCQIDKEGLSEIATRSRGTARIANRLLRRVRDYAQVKYDGKINKKTADEALERLEIDEIGLDRMDRELLKTLANRFNGGPAGLDTLAAAISEEADTIMDVYEPFLLKEGLIVRSPRGRILTDTGYKHIGLIPPQVVKTSETPQVGLWSS
jgi:Holliday junction DNA helicase RuvB